MDKTKPSSSKPPTTFEEWQTITFAKKKVGTKLHQSLNEGKGIARGDQAQVKVYDTASGKFLNPNSFMAISTNVDYGNYGKEHANTVPTSIGTGK